MKHFRDLNNYPSDRHPLKSGTRRVRVFVTGRVQGVFFRAETKKQALALGLRGWVRNLQDGRVESVFEGTENEVETMIAWCKKGPRFARVKGVEIMEDSPSAGTGFDNFEIRY